MNYAKAPFPWFGGKRQAAPLVWTRFGDVGHYVEPFMGSLAVLLLRPHECNRPYNSETVNDADGMLVNAWRSIQLSPEATAEWASYPVSECDLTARHLWLVRWRAEVDPVARLCADLAWHDPQAAGWWLWGISCWIGGEWCSGRGPWVVGADGRIARRTDGEPGVKRPRPHLGSDGNGVNHANTREPGVARQLPHLSDDGKGVNRPQIREPGVKRRRPHLSSNGQGVNHAGTREPGVKRKLPHLGNDGQGVNRPQIREPGVDRQRPHLGNNGQGVNRPQIREPGVKRQRPHLSSNGQDVHHPQIREPGVKRPRPHLGCGGEGVHHAGTREPGVSHAEPGTPDRPWVGDDFHPMTMPELATWFRFLAARLRHVRIICGDWSRSVTRSASLTLSCDEMHPCGVFLDPPYGAAAGRDMGLYTEDSGDVAHEVRAWCMEHGDDPRYRIALAGFEGEGHETLEAGGWTCEEWYARGYLTGGYGNSTPSGDQQHRERIWFSPHCLRPEDAAQIGLFDD